jgi:small subunit ribosomal protein S6
MEKERSYTALFIIAPEKSEAMDEMKEAIGAIIKENSGKIEKEDAIGKRTLSYPIKKHTTGVYYEVTLTALPSGIAAMNRQFRINTDILRTLIDIKG